MKLIYLISVGAIAITLMSTDTQAASIAVLSGNTYKDYVTEDTYKKEVITIDHFGVWKYGTIFFYYDISNGRRKNEKSDFFGGISPTFSLSKMTGNKVSVGAIKDVHLKVELEHVSNQNPVHYYGLMLDLEVPRFNYFNVSPVFRDDPNKAGVGGQLNMAWGMPIRYSKAANFSFQGFVSAGVIPEAKDEFFLVTQPQFLYDMSHVTGMKTDEIQVGVEYSYALNRFLKKGTPDGNGGKETGFNEQVLQAMVKMNY